METQEIQSIEQIESERRTNYFARVTGAVMGAVATFVTGGLLLRQSLYQWLRRRLHLKDYITIFEQEGASLEQNKALMLDSVLNRAKGWSNDFYAAGNAPDAAAKAAFGDIGENSAIFKNALKRYGEEAEKLITNFQGRLKWVRENYKEDKLADEERQIRENIRYLIQGAKEKYLDKPIFREMMKSGKLKGHMGLALRQADNKEQIIAFSIITGVAVGAVVYGAARWLLGRSGQKNQKSYQQQVLDQKQQAPAEGTAL